MVARHCEEVLNPILAEVIVTHSLHASPETIRRRSSQGPDVLLCWCVIEGKITDTGSAKAIVQNDTVGHIVSGLTH